FHGDGWSTLAALARVDAAVRSDVAAQIPFVDAYRRSGLRNRVRSEAPEAAARLDAALLEIDAGPAGRTPAGWVQLWSRLLQCLGWRGWRAAGAADAGAADQRHWEAALRDFAMLTPIVGAVPEARALAELDASLRRTRPANPVPLRGVHVLRSIAAIGPGYAGAWIAGATDSELPAPARLNPLLPRHVQVDAGMPWSSPQDALRRSRELVAEAVRRVPECVFSWPARDGEQEHEPSPLIDGFAAADAPPRKRRSERATLPGAAELECVSDAAPPLESAEIRGGTAALNAQSLSPLRAFCEFRLAAKPLEPFARGVPARVRGIATHAALERFFRVYDSRRRLAAASAGERRLRAARCAQEALAGLFGAARGPLTALFELERDRLAMMIERLADKELERSDYRVEELEQKRSLEVRGRVLRLRIDRIDALEDDGIAVIDYKTGRGIPASSWLSPRPRDVQLPTYALVLPNSAALVVASLRAGDVRYAGIWPKGAFPGQSRGNGESIEQLLETWRHTVGALVDEYCGGDTRFFAGDPEPIGGVYAPLTRLYEQLALHRAREARERP
ncbi:MAG: PD-(D/E)XK nuclease family protein, partial [Gammaproteobacteria bacterium]|nr:PD-(D/E)XK nuclease family protein [Gammaproteobacteria bacterium]